jgi:hypothetical protein
MLDIVPAMDLLLLLQVIPWHWGLLADRKGGTTYHQAFTELLVLL